MRILVCTLLLFFLLVIPASGHCCWQDSDPSRESRNESNNVLRAELVVRYHDEISSPPFSLSTVNSRLVHLQKPQMYCGVWDYRYWLLRERTRLRDELGFDDKQSKELEKIESEILEIRDRFRKAAGEGVALSVDLLDDLSSSIKSELNGVLSDSQMSRLVQLETHYLLARYGSAMINALPQLAKLNGLFDEASQLESQAMRLRGLGKSIDATKLLPSGKPLLRQWLEGVVSKPQVKSMLAEADEFGLTYYSGREVCIFLNLEPIIEELEKNDSLFDTWGTTSYAKVRPTGRMLFDFESGKDSAAIVFLANIALDSTLSNYLQLTSEQSDMAVSILGDAKRDDWSDERLTEAIEDVLVPMQIDLVKERAVWREVEVFGFGPSVVAGRLGRKLALNKGERELLKNRAANMHEKVLQHAKEQYEKRLKLVDELFVDLGLEGARQTLFGDSPNSALLEFSIERSKE